MLPVGTARCANDARPPATCVCEGWSGTRRAVTLERHSLLVVGGIYSVLCRSLSDVKMILTSVYGPSKQPLPPVRLSRRTSRFKRRRGVCCKAGHDWICDVVLRCWVGQKNIKNGSANVFISVGQYPSYPTHGAAKVTYLSTLPSEAIAVQFCKRVPKSFQGYACPGTPLSLADGDWAPDCCSKVQLYVLYIFPRDKHAGFCSVDSQISTSCITQHVYNVPSRAKSLSILVSQAGQRKKEVALIVHPVLYYEGRHRFRCCVGSTRLLFRVHGSRCLPSPTFPSILRFGRCYFESEKSQSSDVGYCSWIKGASRWVLVEVEAVMRPQVVLSRLLLLCMRGLWGSGGWFRKQKRSTLKTVCTVNT